MTDSQKIRQPAGALFAPAGVRVEVSEFISDGGEREILPRRAKRHKATFCEIIRDEGCRKKGLC